MKKFTFIFLCITLLIGSASAEDLLGRVFNAGGANPGYTNMALQRFVFSMTTEDNGAGEHWATFILTPYPGADASLAGFMFQAYKDPTNSHPVAGRNANWGFATMPTLEDLTADPVVERKLYDEAPVKNNTAGTASIDEYATLEYLDVTYEGWDTPVPGVRVRFRYNNQLDHFTVQYKYVYNDCATGVEKIGNYQIYFDNTTGNNRFPYLELDGSLAAELNAANPVLSLEGRTFDADAESPMQVNPIDLSARNDLTYTTSHRIPDPEDPEGIAMITVTETHENPCGILLAATNFSPKTAGETHVTLNNVAWYDITDNLQVSTPLEEIYRNGAFMDQDYGYAIVSNPKTLDGRLQARTDGENRMIVKAHPLYATDEPILTLSTSGLRKGSKVYVEVDWEYESPDCWQCACATCEPRVQENSAIRVLYNGGSAGEANSVNRNARQGTISFTRDCTDGTIQITPVLRTTKDCDAIAIKGIRVYGCPEPYLDKNIWSNSDCEGTDVTLTVKALGTTSDTYTWYERTGNGGYQLLPGETGHQLTVTLDLQPHTYYAELNGVQTKPLELQGIVCCETTDEAARVLWSQDFGTVPPGTMVRYTDNTAQSVAKVTNHYFAGPGVCCNDGAYRIVSNSWDASHADPADPATKCTGWNSGYTGDHTGNPNGGYLVINTGSTMGEGELTSQMLQIDVVGNFCANSWYNFSMWATQITNRTNLPCTIVLEIWELIGGLEGTDGNLLGYITTGEMTVFEMERWVNYSLSVNTTQSVDGLRIKIWNRGEYGNGNDLVLDDLQFTTCSPAVQLQTANNTDEITVDCNRRTTLHCAYNGHESSFFPDGGYYLWQTSDDGIHWTSMGEPEKGRLEYEVTANSTSGTLYRVIVAASAEIALTIASDNSYGECGIYTITNTATVYCEGSCDQPAAATIYHE